MDEPQQPPPHAEKPLTHEDVLRLIEQHGGPYFLDLRHADLRQADLSGLDLFRADLQGAKLAGANLQGVDLRQADLRRVRLADANLQGALLWGVNLTHRGLPKVTLHCTLSMLVMQAKALECAREGNFAEMRMCRRKVA